MQFLIDESTGKALVKLLKNAGYDAVFSRDILPAADDEELLAFAEVKKRILITDDKDFGELVFRLNRPTSGVILLRTSATNPQKRFEMISNILDKSAGKFIVVTEGRIRIREL